MNDSCLGMKTNQANKTSGDVMGRNTQETESTDTGEELILDGVPEEQNDGLRKDALRVSSPTPIDMDGVQESSLSETSNDDTNLEAPPLPPLPSSSLQLSTPPTPGGTLRRRFTVIKATPPPPPPLDIAELDSASALNLGFTIKDPSSANAIDDKRRKSAQPLGRKSAGKLEVPVLIGSSLSEENLSTITEFDDPKRRRKSNTIKRRVTKRLGLGLGLGHKNRNSNRTTPEDIESSKKTGDDGMLTAVDKLMITTMSDGDQMNMLSPKNEKSRDGKGARKNSRTFKKWLWGSNHDEAIKTVM